MTATNGDQTTATPSPSGGIPGNKSGRRVSGFAVVASFLVALALVIPILMTMRDTTGQPRAARDSAVERVTPESGALEFRQTSVGVDLASSVEFMQITIDNRIIPDDQLSRVTATNQIQFTPGAEREFSEFDAGRHCAAVAFKPLNANETLARSYSWCFTAH